MKNCNLTLLCCLYIGIAALLQSIPAFSQIAQTDGYELLYHWSDDTLVPSVVINNTYNEVFGFVKDGREYAVIGSTAGTHVFDITDNDSVHQVAFFEGAYTGTGVIHRDYDYYNGYLYMVCDEGSSTLQIADMQNMPDVASVVYDSNELFARSHNIFIDTAKARLYACAPANSQGFVYSMMVYNISNPTTPTLMSIPDLPHYTHDAYIRNDTAYLNLSGYGLGVYDYSNPFAANTLGTLTDYASFTQGYNHSGWLNEKGNIYVFADENYGYPLKVCDVTDLSDIKVVSTLSSGGGPNSIPHNMMIKDDLVYVAYYHDGLQVFDISVPEQPVKTGSFKTYYEDDHEYYSGAWGVHVFPSGKIAVSDMQFGLYIVQAIPTTPTSTIATTPTQPKLRLQTLSPSDNTLLLHYYNFDVATSAQFCFYDLQGRRIAEQQQQLGVGSGSLALPFPASLSAGSAYVVQLNTSNGLQTTAKFVKF